MAGQLKVDSINADSNLTLRIANTAVAFIDSNGLRPSSGNVSLDATGTTGIRSPSANTLVFYEGGVEAMRIDSSGNVGIGTSSPAQKLDVASKVQIDTANSYGKIKIARATDSGVTALYIQGADNAGTGNELSLVNAGGVGSAMNIGSDIKFYVNSNTTERMRITSAGGVSFGSSGTAYGTAGQVLTSNGDAAPTWKSGAVLVGTTSISAGSTSVDVTSQMTNAGWYMINLQLTLSAAASATPIGIRTSTDNGSTFSSGASDYADDGYNSGTPNVRTYIATPISTNTTNAVFWGNLSILMYTGNGTNPNFFNIQGTNGTSTTSNGFGGSFGWRASLTQVNAIRLFRVSGTRTMSSGNIYVYYLGQ